MIIKKTLKPLFLSLAALILFIPCFGSYKYAIQVNTTTLNNVKIYLNLFDLKRIKVVKKDTSVFSNNQLILQGQTEQLSTFTTLSVAHNGKMIFIDFVLDTGMNKLTLELSGEKIKNLMITNSTSTGHAIFTDLNGIMIKHFEKAAKSTGNRNELVLHKDLYTNMLFEVMDTLKSHPNHPFSMLQLYRMSRMSEDPTYHDVQLVTFNTFSEELKSSTLGKIFLEEQVMFKAGNIAALVGKNVPEFSVKDLSGSTFKNSSLAGQNYIIAFSAVWCSPCQVELKKLSRIYKQYKSRGLKVVYFNDDDNNKRWKDHVLKNNLSDWINVSEGLRSSESKIPKSFGIHAIPSYLLINKKGLIIYNSNQNDREINNLKASLSKLYP